MDKLEHTMITEKEIVKLYKELVIFIEYNYEK